MEGLDERTPQLASEVYPDKPQEHTSPDPLRQNITKLLLARWSQVDSSKYNLISGKGTDYAQRQLHITEIKKWAKNIQSRWIGPNSWLQRYITGALCWSDYQKVINNLHRTVKLLKIAPDSEISIAREQRLERRREYKKALRVHKEHILIGPSSRLLMPNERTRRSWSNIAKVSSLLTREQSAEWRMLSLKRITMCS
jgi:hypothetical protein